MTFPFDQLQSETQSIIDQQAAKPRMKLLNKLLAAPGQPSRVLVTDFLVFKKWIKHDQKPENWPVAHLPRTTKESLALSDEIYRFERTQRQPEIVT